MPFNLSFNARSWLHALRLLEQRDPQLPTPVLNFIKVGIENLKPVKDAQRTIIVEASAATVAGSWARSAVSTIAA
jgi:hypothetical protein